MEPKALVRIPMTEKEIQKLLKWSVTQPGCKVPDCDYAACEDGKCYAHLHGKNPVMTFETYIRRNASGDFCNALGEKTDG